jgi:hypothetical protein
MLSAMKAFLGFIVATAWTPWPPALPGETTVVIACGTGGRDCPLCAVEAMKTVALPDTEVEEAGKVGWGTNA